MKRIILTGAALLAVVPASLGLIGNTSFAQSVPVRVPSQASVLDDRGELTRYVESGDDKGGENTHAEPGDDKGGQIPHIEPGDDKGGPSSHVEPGDDKSGPSSHVEPGEGKVSNSGSGRGDTGVKDSLKGSGDDGSGHT